MSWVLHRRQIKVIQHLEVVEQRVKFIPGIPGTRNTLQNGKNLEEKLKKNNFEKNRTDIKVNKCHAVGLNPEHRARKTAALKATALSRPAEN